MFDVDWLYETERFNDFSDGLNQWTVFNYIKGITGHCCYNRIAGCETLSHSEKEGKQMLHLKYQKDESLVLDTRGAVWNFPVMKKGTFKTSIRIPEGSEEVYLLLINHPAILFGDEPTGALNSSATREVMDIINGINGEGTTVLLVTHDAKVAARADRVIYLEDGSIKEMFDLGKYVETTVAQREEKLKVWLENMGF